MLSKAGREVVLSATSVLLETKETHGKYFWYQLQTDAGGCACTAVCYLWQACLWMGVGNGAASLA